MDPNLQYTPSSVREPERFTNYPPPSDPVHGRSPEPENVNATTPGQHAGHHGGHHWIHLLMCAPMLLVVGFLVVTGRAGGGSIFYAVGCMLMMGVMMALMNRGSSSDDPANHGEHRH